MKRFLAVVLAAVLLAGTDVFASAAVVTPDTPGSSQRSVFTSPDESLDAVSESNEEEVKKEEENSVTVKSAGSAIQSVKTALQPVVLKSVSNYNYKTLKLSWSKNTESTGYLIYRSTKEISGYKRIAKIKSNKTTSYKDSTCTTGTTYYYKIIAYKTTSAKTYKSIDSNIVKRTAKCAKPKTVTVSSAAYNKLKIKWSAVNGANGYYIYRSTTKNGKYTRIATISKKGTLSYTDTKRACGKYYYYKVAAWRKVSGKKKIGTLSVVKAGKAVPAAPTKLTLTPKNGKKMLLTWKKAAGAQSYTVLRATSKNGTYQTVKKGITKLTYTDSKLTANKRYYYKVLAVRNGTEGKKCTAVSAKAFNFGLSASSVSVIRGGSTTVKATSSGDAAVTWSSADKTIATVSSKGKITGKKAGSTKVYAKSHGVTLTVKVKVTTLEYGIDISHWQGNIDWSSVRSAGYTFAMLKATQGTTYTDPTFVSNYNAAKSAGLKVGCYAYSTATSVAAAEAEARYLVKQLGGRKMDYPVTLDFEDSSILASTNNQVRTDMIFAYQRIITGAGYKFALYANLNWLTNYIDNSRLVGMDIWIARYRDASLGHGYTGGGNVTMWQYSSTGTVPGISGNVDMDFCYKAY